MSKPYKLFVRQQQHDCKYIQTFIFNSSSQLEVSHSRLLSNLFSEVSKWSFQTKKKTLWQKIVFFYNNSKKLLSENSIKRNCVLNIFVIKNSTQQPRN